MLYVYMEYMCFVFVVYMWDVYMCHICVISVKFLCGEGGVCLMAV